MVLLVLLMVGRALYVVPACWLHNLWSAEKVSVRDVVIIWCAAGGTPGCMPGHDNVGFNKSRSLPEGAPCMVYTLYFGEL